MTAIIGAALVIGASSAMGFGVAAEKRRGVLCAEGFLALVEYIEASLPSLAPLEDIISSFDNKSLSRYGVTDILLSSGGPMPCNKRLAYAIELQREDKALYCILSPLARGLGSTDYQSQAQSLARARAALASLCAARKRDSENSEKCFKWLGVLAGTAAVILLI